MPSPVDGSRVVVWPDTSAESNVICPSAKARSAWAGGATSKKAEIRTELKVMRKKPSEE
jgi:hypothetical protein